jgi:hypothetical protein
VLRSVRDEGGVRHLEARLNAAGDMVVEGQDLGPAVEAAFGSGIREYEWMHTVRAEHLPQLVDELGGAPGEDVLDVLDRNCRGSDAGRLEALVSPQTGTVPAEFWSRVGD